MILAGDLISYKPWGVAKNKNKKIQGVWEGRKQTEDSERARMVQKMFLQTSRPLDTFS